MNISKKEAEERIKKLKETINYHRYLYHVKDRQEISDSALDSLKKELFDLENRFPELKTADSPTQRVGGEPLDKFKKVKHFKKMLSLNDAFSEEEMEEWKKRISKLLTKKESESLSFFCELKIDGLAVELVYEKGFFKTGSTRGDGDIGENITQNLKTIEAIPLKIRDKRDIALSLKKSKLPEKIKNKIKENLDKQIIARGEVFISKKDFNAVNEERKKSGDAIYANPRNLAAGSVRQLDPKITAKRDLDNFAYDLIGDFKEETHQQKHQILKIIGFKTSANEKLCLNLEEVFNFYQSCHKLRENLQYEIDGVVVTVNSNSIFDKLGFVGKAPRGAIAFKFPAEEKTTKVKDIKVQVGRTGALTPVAVLEPVNIGGAIVSRATLHNEDEIERLGIKIGDTVIVRRAGDVIPDVLKVLKDLRTGKEKEFKMPSKCPICEGEVKRKKGEAVHYCSNINCFAVLRRQISHFVSKSAFNIEGLGQKIIDQLIKEGLITDSADIFSLKKEDLISLERFAEKSADNLILAIKKSKSISLSRFIYSLGIRNVGEETAIDLAKEFGSIDNLEKSSLDDLERIEDIGPVVAKSIYAWFKDGKNKNLIRKIKKFDINIQKPVSDSKNNSLSGKAFVITGVLDAISRDGAKQKIRNLGGKTAESLSKNIDYLVVGKNPGSKLKKAKEIGVKIIKEGQFLNMLK